VLSVLACSVDGLVRTQGVLLEWTTIFDSDTTDIEIRHGSQLSIHCKFLVCAFGK
jgi:hypothetical protein